MINLYCSNKKILPKIIERTCIISVSYTHLDVYKRQELATASGAKICLITKYNEPKPKTAKPATPIPITEPPVKETFNAFARDVFAASAVLTFDLVAIFIPINPAEAERMAPKTKDIPKLQCELELEAPIKPSKTATIITK